jgi:hypothetical protein
MLSQCGNIDSVLWSGLDDSNIIIASRGAVTVQDCRTQLGFPLLKGPNLSANIRQFVSRMPIG